MMAVGRIQERAELEGTDQAHTTRRRKIRVMIVHNFPTPYRLELFEQLLKDDDLEVRVAFTGKPRSNRPTWSTNARENDEKIQFLPGIGIPIHGRFEDRVFLNFGLGRLLEWKPEVILLFGYSDPTNWMLSALCVRRKIPYILFAEVSYGWGKGLVARVSRPLTEFMVRNASYLAPASRSAASFFKKMGGEEDITIVVPCVPDILRLMKIRERIDPERNEILRKLGLDGKFIVLYVGRLQPYKGIAELFDGVEIALRKAPKLSLILVGTGPLKNFVEERCLKDPSHLSYLGVVDEPTLHELFSISDLHVMPSWSEAFGVVCPEALAFGVPSAVTRTSGCSDLITDGSNGFLIDPSSSYSIAGAIEKAYRDPQLLARMKVAASEKAKSLNMQEIAALVKNAIIGATATASNNHLKKGEE